MYIENLAKELELYKNKAAIEIEKKLTALESKAKAEAKTLQLNNEHLKEMLTFKATKITEYQREIERLKTVLRTDASFKGSIHYENKVEIEKRLDEVASKGKIEYKILLIAEDNPLLHIKNAQSLSKVLNFSSAALTNGLVLQARMLEENINNKETLKAKFEELTVERNKLESHINDILQYEKLLQEDFKSISNQTIKIEPKSSKTIGLSQSPIYLKESNESITLAQKHINKLINQGKLVKATEMLKKENYELQEEAESAVQKLRLICKVRDKQLDNFKKEINNSLIARKCAELVEDDINEILNEYDESKGYAKELNLEETKLKDSQAEVDEVKKSISNDEKGLINKENERLEEELKEVKEIMAIKDEEMNGRLKKIVEEKESIIEKYKKELDDYLSNQKIENEELRNNMKVLEDTNDSLKSQIEELNKTIKKKEEKIKGLEQLRYLKAKMGDPPLSLLETYKSTIPTYSRNKTHLKTIADNENTITQKLIEEVEIANSIVEDITTEHTDILVKIEKIINHKNLITMPRLFRSKNLCEQLMNELQAARKVNFLINGIAVPRVSKDILKSQLLSLEKSREPINELYKEFFIEKRVYPITVESLLDRLRMKNLKFKELFKQCEKALSINELVNTSKSSLKESIEENTMKELLAEIKELKDKVSSKESFSSENSWKQKAESLEEALQVQNVKIKEYKEELERQVEAHKIKDKEIQTFNNFFSGLNHHAKPLKNESKKNYNSLDVNTIQLKETEKKSEEITKKNEKLIVFNDQLLKEVTEDKNKSNEMNTRGRTLTQKYENWLSSIQEPMINIRKILFEVYGTEFNLNNTRIMPKDIRETLLRAYDLLINFRNELDKKEKEAQELREEVKRLNDILQFKDSEIKEFSGKIKELKGDFERLSSFTLRKKEQKASSKRNLIGNNKQMEGIHKKEIDEYKLVIIQLTNQKEKLEEYNKKANEEILILLNTLKAEQEKQKLLSSDLEALTNELKKCRIANDYD